MKKYKLKIGLALILTILNFFLYAQEQKKIDSLFVVLKTAKEDTNKVNVLYELCHQYYMLDESKKVLKYGMELKALCEKIHCKNGLANSLRAIASAYRNLSDYPNSLEFHLQSLKIYEELGRKTDIASECTNIGLIYTDLGEYKKAMEYELKGLKIKEKINDKVKIANSLSNIANIYALLLNFPKALDFQFRSLKIREKLKDPEQIANSLTNIGTVYCEMEEYTKALEYQFKSLEKFNVNENKYGIASVLGSIGTIYIDTKQYALALKYSLEAMKLAQEINNYYMEKEIQSNLYKIYKETGKSEKALEHYERYILLKDSIFNEDNQKQIIQKQMKFDFDKKQALANAEQEKRNIVNAAKSRQQQLVIILVLSVLILVIVFSFFIYTRFRITKKQKYIIEEKNFELNQQNEEISSQRDEITAQRDLVIQQKLHIEHIHLELTDSIYYAERIQKAVLPDEQYVKDKIIGEFFILFKPKDIVSGDFYFIEQRKNILLIAVADCTGHGVPGAFMSMLGISFLNEIISKDEVKSASYVLDELRNHVIHSLQQRGIEGEQKDGMDISFIALNTDKNELQFSGANNPLYLIRTDNNNELIEIKGDKMPVAIHEKMNNFTNHTLQLQKGDIFYLMSDGYQDQFGGPKGKKILTRNLKHLLSEHCFKSMNNQKEILDYTINNWKNNYGTTYEQTDDITILGIKI